MPTRLLKPLFAAVLLAAAQAPLAQSDVDQRLREALIQAVNSGESFENRYVAEVWLTDMAARLARKVPDIHQRLELLRLVHREATRAELPPELVLAVIEVESNFQRYAISSAGARGLMQIMPFWLKEIGRPEDNLFHIETNLRFGCTILRHYLDREKGNLTRALARYNGSLGKTWYAERVYRAMDRRWYVQ
ncbi:lytic transglycosylase domain-containing protein [Alkalilimnicola sp. S0819]|uniref:lytic transglycosylase domain-containing protein n=1 Tax=Alkalilimnicola sp. S0819 TaxID=2613922 RepID=UPI001262A7EF|nr:lytic transglycosylase domain-containing protein [Alkalilimnicola sp. S0819]KAB7623220.1 lytic transglycosylase domain-containing protein [Alkalilimnicola sp. S0819]MPQ17069.1 transglycosylase SLT domain-containing protein [Alkalilimnicola sp. S0819]